MKTISYTESRARHAEVLHAVTDDREEVITRAGHDPVVMISLVDYESLRETAYLMRSPENSRRLLDAVERLASGARAVHVADSPAGAKALGRRVAGFSEDRWRQARWDVVVSGSCAKFSADSRLRRYLLGAGQAVLVEASPVDRVWGIGLAADSGPAREPAQWPGLNLLGFALMEARARFA